MTRLCLIPFLAFVVATSPAAAQTQNPPENPPKEQKTEILTIPVTVDLAGSSVQSIRIDAGTYRLRLMNAVPGRTYWLHVGPSQTMEIPVLQSEEDKNEAIVPKSSKPTCPVTGAAARLIGAVSEGGVRSAADEVRIQLGQFHPADCQAEIDFAKKILGLTTISFDEPITIVADASRKLEVTSRHGNRWDVELTSMGRGVWQTTYGFVVSPNRDEEFFAENTGESQFTIRRKPRDKNSLTFLPSIMFTWLSSTQASARVQNGPTVGLGVTSSGSGGRVAALVGWSFRFQQNVGLVVGANVYQHRRLDGQYEVNQVLKEDLASDKLNRDSTRFNYFLALTLRFGKNPFGGSAAAKAQDPPKAEPAKGKQPEKQEPRQ